MNKPESIIVNDTLSIADFVFNKIQWHDGTSENLMRKLNKKKHKPCTSTHSDHTAKAKPIIKKGQRSP